MTIILQPQTPQLDVQVRQVTVVTGAGQGPAGPQGIQGPQGLQGIQGIQGPPGTGGDLHYPHDQMVASTLWTINHNLNKMPSITVFDSAGREVEGNVTHVTLNQATVEFAVPFSGKAYCN